MSNAKHYAKGITSGVSDAVKAEWERRQTLGRVVEAVFTPPQTQAINNAARMAVAVTTGTYKGVKSARAEIVAARPAAEDVEVIETIVVEVPRAGGRHRAENRAENQGA
jgi:hypothetical protein